MAIDSKLVCDATTMGNCARFVNHSCDPNCTVEVWGVSGWPCVAIFAGADGLEEGNEITIDYDVEVFERKKHQICLCRSKNCRGFIWRIRQTRRNQMRLYG
jgi:SET domain-containing protein